MILLLKSFSFHVYLRAAVSIIFLFILFEYSVYFFGVIPALDLKLALKRSKEVRQGSVETISFDAIKEELGL
ncbi:MAG: hypothetical protein NTW78_13190 [Campylobacterales bacterium]|nr:hypothetical protein [Campylobacterales bacterium]